MWYSVVQRNTNSPAKEIYIREKANIHRFYLLKCRMKVDFFSKKRLNQGKVFLI